MAESTNRWTGKPQPDWDVRGGRVRKDREPCEHCGCTTVVLDCYVCGAPQCCPECCSEELEEVDE